MRIALMSAALSVFAIGNASASVIQPNLGTSATEASVSGGPGGSIRFTVLGGQGTPGTSNPNYNPAGYFGPTSASVSGLTSDYASNGTNFTSVTGSSAVDLNSGQMHLVANTMRLGTTGNDTSVSSIASSGVLADVLTITGPISAPVTIRISMTVDGSFVSNGPTDLRNSLGAFALAVSGGGGPYAELFLNQLSGGFIQEQDVSRYGGKVITDAGNAASLQFTLYDDVVVTDTSRLIPFQAIGSLNLITPDSPGSISANFGNTARLQVSLPMGLGFVSQSGVFLTAPQDTQTAVPEPASLLVLCVALLGTSVVRLRSGRSGRQQAQA